MANRTQEENIKIIMDALSAAGERGLILEDLREAVFGAEEKQSNSMLKKLLKQLKAKSQIRTKMGSSGEVYFTNRS